MTEQTKVGCYGGTRSFLKRTLTPAAVNKSQRFLVEREIVTVFTGMGFQVGVLQACQVLMSGSVEITSSATRKVDVEPKNLAFSN